MGVGTIRLGWRRILAWGIDWLTIVAWLALLVLVVWPLGAFEMSIGLWGTVAVSTLASVLPVTLWLGWWESARGGTWGKRCLGLGVARVADRERVSFARAWARNLVKIGLPWQVAHMGVAAMIKDPADPPAWAMTANVAAMVIAALWVASLFVGHGRTPYDRLTDTYVRERP